MATDVAAEYGRPRLVYLIRRFLYGQLYDRSPLSDDKLPEFHAKVSVHTSAVTTFYAPSDLSGVGGM
jgi:hypothetical protein